MASSVTLNLSQLGKVPVYLQGQTSPRARSPRRTGMTSPRTRSPRRTGMTSPRMSPRSMNRGGTRTVVRSPSPSRRTTMPSAPRATRTMARTGNRSPSPSRRSIFDRSPGSPSSVVGPYDMSTADLTDQLASPRTRSPSPRMSPRTRSPSPRMSPRTRSPSPRSTGRRSPVVVYRSPNGNRSPSPVRSRSPVRSPRSRSNYM